MEILLEITGWIHYVALAAVVAFAGSLVISTVGELLQRSLREGSRSGSVSVGDPLGGSAL